MAGADPPGAAPRMRVLVVGDRAPDFFADNVLTCLEDAGHRTRSVEVYRGALARNNPHARILRDASQQIPRLARRLQRQILEAAEEFRPDVVINLDFRLSHSLVGDLRIAAGGAPVVFWFPDSPGHVRNETFLLAGYDALYFKDTVQVNRYRQTLGVNAHFLPEGCNPRWHRPIGRLAASSDHPTVVVAGNMYASRFALLQQLQRDGIALRIHGNPWPRWLPSDPALQRAYSGRLILREEKAREFRNGSVLLNSTVTDEGDGLNARLFEGAACGAVVLSEFRSRLPELFAVGSEVATYSDARQLRDEIFRLAALPDGDREAMGAAASARAHSEHGLARRFDVIVSTLGAG